MSEIRRAGCDEVTLGQVIHGPVWGLSFHGGLQEQLEASKDLERQVAVIDLAAYGRVCKAHCWGISKETRFIHWPIDEEFRRCVGGDGGGIRDATSISRPEHIQRWRSTG